MKTIFNKNSLGFTLVEIMVVLAIVVLLSALILSGYSEGRSRLAVERTVEGFLSDLHRARQRGFFGVGYEVAGDVVGSDGHGIRIIMGDNYYVLYIKNSEDIETDRIYIEDFVVFESISISNNNRNSVKMFFEKGGGFKVNGNPNEEVKIVFSAKDDNSIKRTVVINNNGVATIDYD